MYNFITENKYNIILSFIMLGVVAVFVFGAFFRKIEVPNEQEEKEDNDPNDIDWDLFHRTINDEENKIA